MCFDEEKPKCFKWYFSKLKKLPTIFDYSR
jgi:hypothetical protein